MNGTRLLKWLITALLLGSLTIQADPFKIWDWTGPTLYSNGQPIPGTDILEFTLYCNDTSGESGPPYEVAIALDDPGAPPSQEDMAPVVQGRVGVYYCVSTARSSSYNTESGYSNEVNFTVTSMDLGFVPSPPTNLLFQTP